MSDWDNVEIIANKPWSLEVETSSGLRPVATGAGNEVLLWYGTANGNLLPGGEYRLRLSTDTQVAFAAVDIFPDARNQPIPPSPDDFVMKDVERTGAPQWGIGTGHYWPYDELMEHYRRHWGDLGIIADETQPRGLRQYYEAARSLIARGEVGEARVEVCPGIANVLNDPRTFFLDMDAGLLANVHDQTGKIGTFFEPAPDSLGYFYRETGCAPGNFIPTKADEKVVAKAIHDAKKAAKKAGK